MSENELLSRSTRPIHLGVHVGLLSFLLAMGIMVGYFSYRGYSDSIRYDYMVHLKGIIDFVLTQIDVDDLEECINTRTVSPKMQETQHLLDDMNDTLDVEFIYFFVPLNETGHDSALYVMTSNTKEEYEAGTVRSDVLGMLSGDEFPEQIAIDNMKAYLGEGVSYYITESEWGKQYTAAVPVFNSKGERFALLCADANYDEIYKMAIKYSILSASILAGIGVISIALFMRWITVKVTKPIRQLEDRALDFANRCDGSADIDSLHFEAPDIHTGNEVESLTMAISQMALSMQEYMNAVLNAEEHAQSAMNTSRQMTELALKDALTSVKSKVAYDEMKERTESEINQNLAQFAILMIDINNLKLINDNYGHEHGDEYIIGSIKIVCDVYAHSSVFRIGGDEFVVMLRGRDYDNRDELLSILREEFDRIATEEEINPRNRYSIASGMADYADGDTFDDVFRRADEQMYINKKEVKSRLMLYEN